MINNTCSSMPWSVISSEIGAQMLLRGIKTLYYGSDNTIFYGKDWEVLGRKYFRWGQISGVSGWGGMRWKAPLRCRPPWPGPWWLVLDSARTLDRAEGRDLAKTFLKKKIRGFFPGWGGIRWKAPLRCRPPWSGPWWLVLDNARSLDRIEAGIWEKRLDGNFGGVFGRIGVNNKAGGISAGFTTNCNIANWWLNVFRTYY